MKCDELKYERLGDANKTYPASTLVIRKQFVDAAIAELKAKLEDVQATAYAESVDTCMENRMMKRALWLARAERAVAEQTVVMTPWTIQSMEFSRQNTGVSSLSLLQGIFPTRESNPGLWHCRWILYQLSHKGSS